MTYTVPQVFERSATVLRVVDGDTLHIAADVGLDITVNMTVRLAGINTPEINTDEGRAAKRFVEEWLLLHDHDDGFILRTVRDRREKYGRYLADLLPNDGSPSLSQALLTSGNAFLYP